MTDNGWGYVKTTTEAEMLAYDMLPKPLRDFVKTANHQWACGPMLRRAQKAGIGGRWALPRLLKQYQIEDQGAEP